MALLALLVLIFLLQLSRGPLDDAGLLRSGALPDSGGLHDQYWRLATFGFLHSNLTHLLLNALLLLVAGPLLERRTGAGRMLAIFVAASVASGIMILLKHMLWPAAGASVGASGGMFGLLGAAFLLSVRGRARSTRAARLVGAVTAAGLAYSLLPGISMIGHVTGLVVGSAMALLELRYWREPGDRSAPTST